MSGVRDELIAGLLMLAGVWCMCVARALASCELPLACHLADGSSESHNPFIQVVAIL